MAIIDDDDARIISKEIWDDIEFVVYTELDNCDLSELKILSGDQWRKKLDALCDWCFANGIDCQALYLMGEYCSLAELLKAALKNADPPFEIADAERSLPWSAGVGLQLSYLSMRQIAIKLHAPAPSKRMTLNEQIKSKYLSDPNEYVKLNTVDWATLFNVSRQAVEKTQVWKQLIKPMQERIQGEMDDMRKGRYVEKEADLYDPSDSDYD